MLRTTTILALVALMNVAALGQDESKLSLSGAPQRGRDVKLGAGDLKISLHVSAQAVHSLVGFIATAPGIEPVIFDMGYTDGYGGLTRDYAVPAIHNRGEVVIFALVFQMDSWQFTQTNSLSLHYSGSRPEKNAAPGDMQQGDTYIPLTAKPGKADAADAKNWQKQDSAQRSAPRPAPGDETDAADAKNWQKQDRAQRNAPRPAPGDETDAADAKNWQKQDRAQRNAPRPAPGDETDAADAKNWQKQDRAQRSAPRPAPGDTTDGDAKNWQKKDSAQRTAPRPAPSYKADVIDAQKNDSDR